MAELSERAPTPGVGAEEGPLSTPWKLTLSERDFSGLSKRIPLGLSENRPCRLPSKVVVVVVVCCLAVVAI